MSKPVLITCLLDECDGSGWIKTAEGQSIACRCQKVIDATKFATKMQELYRQDITIAFGIDPEELKGYKK